MAAKLRIATVSLAGCFGCHMSFLDIDERLLPLLDQVELDRSPLTDIKHCGHCDIGLIEGGVCNAENVQVLREFRANCKVLVALGACAVNAACRAAQPPLPGRDPADRLPDRARAGAAQRDPERPRACRCRWTRSTRSTRWCGSTISCPAARPRRTRSGASCPS